MRLVLADPTEFMMDEIGMQETTQKSLALTYALAITGGEPVDWKKVNQAIVKRWSESGLNRVKSRAWAMIRAKHAATLQAGEQG